MKGDLVLSASLATMTSVLSGAALPARFPGGGLVLHLDASAFSQSVVRQHPMVSLWKDLSGNGKHVRQENAGLQPCAVWEAQSGISANPERTVPGGY